MKEFYQHHFSGFHLWQTPNLWSTYQSYNYILEKDSLACIFDPGDLQPICNTIEKNHLKPQLIFLTHHHRDHIGAALEIKNLYGCPIMGFSGDKHRLPPLDKEYFSQQILDILGCQAEVIHTPGHTTGICALYFKELNLLFSSDLLFSLGCGRVFEGSYKDMFNSLQKLNRLPDETWILCSHEYTLANLEFALSQFPQDGALLSVEKEIKEKTKSQIPTVPTQLAFERRHNPFLRSDEVGIRQALNLVQAANWQVFAELRQRKDHN